MITLEAVSKRYGPGNVAVEELSLSVAAGEVCMLVGPSGCGKTTTLRMINRLIEPTGGRILLDGRDVLAMDPVELRRGIGYVIQQGGLFPHRRVSDNVATVPRLLGWDRERTSARVEELLHLVGLDPADYGRRYPHELSGGERQRVGVARALGADPPVLLMDEPFGAVDPVTRQRLQQQLLDLQATLEKTIVFVTHDIEEAAKLGDRIAVLSRGGVLEQFDTPSEILGRPATPFVADFVGTDRGVRRLAVVAIEERDLHHPPAVPPTATMDEVARRAGAPGATRREDGAGHGTHGEGERHGTGGDDEGHGGGQGSRWAVVVEPDGSLVGWVTVDAAAAGTAADHAERFAVTVPVGASFQAALGEMLQHDIAWVPVVDGRRYLGVLTPNRVHAAMRRSVGGTPVEP